ncbi:hypothetical protein T281_16750 [Rhodomicrobium udaipurense JA643]|uniref:Uncharacterized protein n=1 Tax=Rhodomicrobium udaipurense TaxID=1202716 RepID=A0A8I1KL97_9HYPH|nr:hypothetical protein [Rhodomicrobium udaipurense]KAI93428.1 hypothetical protein T281_16750 [Rhodomicrobium udaipurense JA643]MBJ7545171.1 hypothetical protein [Rhodomicrobium udaipurense]
MTKSVTKRPRKRVARCDWCGEKIASSGRGRTPRFCSASHRQRAYEYRKLKLAQAVRSPLAALKNDLAETELKRLIAREVTAMVNRALAERGVPPIPSAHKPPQLKLLKPDE